MAEAAAALHPPCQINHITQPLLMKVMRKMEMKTMRMVMITIILIKCMIY